MTASEKHLRWESFESITIKNLGKDPVKAAISHLDKNGKVQSQTFEGTRQEIDKAIAAHKDLPAVEREHLFRGLDMPVGGQRLPGVQVAPGGGLTRRFFEPGRGF